jgi:lipoyl(octanoyl) transferase
VSHDRPIALAWLGRAAYRPVWELQERLRARILDAGGPEVMLLVEHEPVVTLGRSADPAHVLLSDEALRARGVERVACNRGGDVTYHGPGQLVAYPIVRLDRGVATHVEAMAGAVVEVLGRRAIASRFRSELPGVWVAGARADEPQRKIAAFGVHVHRRVAIHGLSLNVTTAEEAFAAIVPCGLSAPVTSLAALLDPLAPPPLPSLARELGETLARHLGRSPAEASPDVALG